MNALLKSTPSFGEATRRFIEAGISEKALIPIAPPGAEIYGKGSLSPGGAMYEWHRKYDLCDLVADGELAQADDANMGRFLTILAEEVETAGGEVLPTSSGAGGGGGDRRDYSADEPALPVEAIFRALESLPNTEADFPTHDSFVAVLAKIRAALGCEAEAERDRVEEWACEDLELCSHDYFEKTWDSLRRGVGVSRRALERFLREKRIFPNLENEFPNLTQAEKDELSAVTKPFREMQDALLDEFAKTYVLGRANAATDDRVPTIRRKDEPDTAAVALNWWQSRTDDLNVQLVHKLRTCGQYTPDDTGLWSFIREIRKKRPEITFMGTTLHPGYGRGEIVVKENPDGTTTRKLNMRFESPVIRWAKKAPRDPERAKADVEIWLEFVGRLFGPDADYELDTLAYMAQTGNRPGHFLYLVGEPGVGKTTHIHILEMLFDGPSRSQGAIDGTKLVSEGSRRFALAKIEGRRIVSVQELPDNISSVAKAQITSILKQVVDIGGGGYYIQIERKGQDITAVQNFARFTMTTNYDNALPIEPNDRRAFYVRCNIIAEDKPSSAYYERLAAIGKNPERLAEIWRYLLKRDWRAIYDPAKAPPLSNAKLEAQIIAIEIAVKRHVAAALALLSASGRAMLDVQELAELASDMSENEYLNTDGAIDDRAEYDFQRPSAAGQAALRYLKAEALKVGGGKDGRGYKVDGGTRRLPVIYVFKKAKVAGRLSVADRDDVLDALHRDRRRPLLMDRHPLKRFAGL
jgi:hypothetical protein